MMEETLQIGICDDKLDDLKLTEAAVYDCVKKIGISCTIECYLFQDGEKMCAEMEKRHFDLILFTIEVPEVNVFRLIKRISTDRSKPSLIFVSSHENVVFEVQEFMPLWFVRKAMLKKDMYRALRKYRELTVLKNACYPLKYGNVYIRNIVYIESCGHLMIIQMADGKVIKQYGSLRVMEEGLSQYHFLRTHKSYLVNARYIKDIGKREIYLTNGAMLEIGRDRRKSLLQVIYKMDEFN